VLDGHYTDTYDLINTQRNGPQTILIFLGATFPQWDRASSFTRFLDHTQRRITVGITPLDEWSARRRDLYLTTHNTNNRQTYMPSVGFEPTISSVERPQTYALDSAATGIGTPRLTQLKIDEILTSLIRVRKFLPCGNENTVRQRWQKNIAGW
jgi:hypothetical protein